MIFNKLILSSFKRHAKIYIPYLISNIILVAMDYILLSLQNSNEISKLSSGITLIALLKMGSVFVMMISFVFMLYINNFLRLQKTREMGLYSMLGMTTNNLRKMSFLEKSLLFFISTIFGLVFGFVFEKLSLMTTLKLINVSVSYNPTISMSALSSTIILFFIIYLCMLFFDFFKLHKLNPTELWKEQSKGESSTNKHYKLGGIIGILSLVGAYYLTLSTKPTISAYSHFMLAVVLVVVGTYLLFISGSILILNLLKSSKRFYYKPNHFIAVSGMLQRMKQNGAGLATICLLCSSVLVIMFSSISIYSGIGRILNVWTPSDVAIINGKGLTVPQNNKINAVSKKYNAKISHRISFSTTSPQYGYLKNDSYVLQGDINNISSKTTSSLMFMGEKDYNKIYHKNINLDDSHALMYAPFNVNKNNIKVLGKNYSTKQMGTFRYSFNPSHSIYSSVFMIVKKVPKSLPTMHFNGFDYQTSNNVKFENAMQRNLKIPNGQFTGKSVTYQMLTQLFGGLVMIGILVSLTLLLTTVMVIYFKQISEGYSDRKRFITMQQVGLSHKETTKSIHSQVIMVFMLPIAGSIINLIFAVPAIKQVITEFGLYDSKLLIVVGIIVSIALIALYLIVYVITTRMYHHIVD
ncbi:ABC transporter permease [Apilactobacillus apisilvae]|uniref:ABC transporter permease n=1 Tax=Apilactobacillus apisilvae TaxID=2923364 RepID=A0ABY4PFN1_9LACO|nr:ABC transporter permease [Apilactobacillus apisilvae]UQS84590.1 ABC transporter permease [Apilactobacillus apisilvae]